jgi:hypothetical protein
MVKFPGAYKQTDPEVNFSLWSGYKPYTMPGPAIWTGGSAGGSSSPATGSKPVSTSVSTPVSTPVASKAPAATPSAAPSTATVHTDENCHGNKLARTRRAFRKMLLKA